MQVLINIRGEETIQEELDGAVSNKTVFQKIAKKWEKEGYQRDRQQCRTKVKNLKGNIGRSRTITERLEGDARRASFQRD